MSAKPPWWFSDEQSGGRGFDFGAKGLDLGSLAAGAQQVLEWARESLVTSHQSHVNPADYPTCFMCRAVQLLHPSAGTDVVTEDEDFFWIELDEPRD